MLPTAALLLGLSAVVVSGHMLVASPATWGLSDELENPLNANTPNWLCAGQKHQAGRPALSLRPGGILPLPITCGRAHNAPTRGKELCETSAPHGGGGCLLSIAYNTLNPRPSDFVVISSVANCPTLEFGAINFPIPQLPACENCTVRSEMLKLFF